MHSFSVFSENVTINHCRKRDSLGYIFVADSMGHHCDVIVPGATDFGEQNNGHYAVRGHSKSPISVAYQLKSGYDFLLVNLASFPFRGVV